VVQLMTLVHISDLHFGETDPKTGSARLDAQLPPWWPGVRWFDGYLGHHGAALRHLDDFLAGLGEPSSVVLTGDLTSCAAAAEFRFASQYLGATVPMNGIPIGVADAALLAQRTVPGNHDHWPGVRASAARPLVMFGRTSPALATTLAPAPRHHRLPLANSGVDLTIGLIDTDADVRPLGPSRGLARGSFVSQLNALQAAWGPPTPGEIRLVLLHHSALKTGVVHGMTSTSRTAYTQFLSQNEVSIALTGHLHAVRARASRISHQQAVWDFVEARCGSTTQRDTLPLGYCSSPPTRPLTPNSLLVHRFEQDAGKIYFRVESFVRGPRGFKADPRFSVENLAARRVQVWPR
jgi:Calcineurin-like phosphoesterase